MAAKPKSLQNPKKRDEIDTPWKTILGTYFRQFMEYFLPDTVDKIDFARGYHSLDKELSKITAESKVGNRLADKLIQVYLKDGTEEFVLIHIEVQGSKAKDFAKRMFTYFSRILDHYNKPILSIAMLVDDNKDWRPNSYQMEQCGCTLNFTYRIIKVLDFRDQKTPLNKNPFQHIVRAQLASIDTKDKSKMSLRLRLKIELTKELTASNLDKETKRNLYCFQDFILQLPMELAEQYNAEIDKHQGELKMTYITQSEQIVMKKAKIEGKAVGMHMKALEIAKNLLMKGLGIKDIAEVTKLPLSEIKHLKVAC